MFSESEIASAYAAVESSSEQRRPPKRSSAAKRKRASTGDSPTRAAPIMVSPPAAEDLGEAAAAGRATTVVPMPRIQPMGALLREFPHIRMDSTCAHALAKLATNASSAAAAGAGAGAPAASAASGIVEVAVPRPERLHFDASQEVPVALVLLLRSRQALVPPTFLVQGSTAGRVDHAAELLRAGQVSLPCYSAAHETALLVEAGSFDAGDGRVVTLPPCCRGRTCVGMTENIQGLAQPITLMRAMTPAELAALLARGEQPPGEAPCVLCHRHTLANYVHHKRLLGSTTADEGVFQLWHNSYDEEGGYYKDHMLLPRANEVVVSPLAESTYWGIKARPHPEVMHRGTQRPFWLLDQTPMVWKPRRPLAPYTGEALSHF